MYSVPTPQAPSQPLTVDATNYSGPLSERMKLATNMNYFALLSRQCLKAVQVAFQELQSLRLVDAEPGSFVR
jgi:hypothetical protein